MAGTVPRIDAGARERLENRFGDPVQTWFEELPGLLNALAVRWRLELLAPIPRGTVSVVFWCRLTGGSRAVLKVSPDRERVAGEAVALRGWQTVHSPAVLQQDERAGALLIEAIEPGSPLDSTTTYPSLESVAQLLAALHASGQAWPFSPRVERRVAYLFESSRRLYERHPDLTTVLTPDLYELGHELATRLARDGAPAVRLHGDLTPANIIDGGERGLVAIDPAPCLGDAAFDAVDLVFWRADDVRTVEARIRKLAVLSGLDASRLHGWCVAFAGMAALELATDRDPPITRIEALRLLASRAAGP